MHLRRPSAPFIAPRDAKWKHTAPPWLRALSDPEPQLEPDDAALIEHIRHTGQLASGEIREIDSLHWRPLATRASAPVSRDASQRLNAATRAAIEAEDAARAARHAQYERELAAARKRAEKRRAEYEDRIRRRAEKARAQWTAQREYEQVLAARAREQARRDREWDDATRKADAAEAARILAGHHALQKVAHEQRKQRIAVVLDKLREQKIADIRVGDLMLAVGCSDEAEFYRCVQELGLQWRPG